MRGRRKGDVGPLDELTRLRVRVAELEACPPAWQRLLQSRKFILAVISVGVYLGGKLGLDLDGNELAMLVAPLWGGIAGTVVEDYAKHKGSAVAPSARS